jgi:catalase
LAGDGDPLDDPTAAWPDDRAVVLLGHLEVTALAYDRERDGDVLVFDPTRVPDGIRLTDDPILLARPGAYSVSIARRTAPASG